MDYTNPMKFRNPIDQKVDQVQRKLLRLHADEESLAIENRQLHKGRNILYRIRDKYILFSDYSSNN